MNIFERERFTFSKMEAFVKKKEFEKALDQMKAVSLRYPNEPLPYENAATLCAQMGDFDRVKFYAHKAVDINKQAAQCWFLLAFTYNKELKFPAAEICALNAISAKGDFVAAMRELAESRMKMGKYSSAMKTVDKAIEINPNYAPLYHMKGMLSEIFRNHEEGEKNLTLANQKDPKNPIFYNALGNFYINQSRYEEATDVLQKAIDLAPNSFASYWNIVRSKKFKSEDSDFIKKIQDIYIDKQTQNHDKTLLAFSLGKIYQDLGFIELSFECYTAGNTLQKKQFNYNFVKDQYVFSTILKDQPKLIYPTHSKISENMDDKSKPIFIVGMPRSGTSLVEQILSAHSDVDGLGELEFMNQINAYLTQSNIRKASIETKIQVFREKYMESLKNFEVRKPFFTDKMPTNFRYIGWIVNSFPEAKIIHMSRKPEAVCFSNYTHMFPASGLAWTCDQLDVARFFKLYENMMEYFTKQFPNKIYTINYEFFTENQKTEIPKLLDYCELDVQQACFEFYKADRSVHTASQQQVKKKMYTGSSEVWRQYEEWLGPMLSVLRQ